MNEQSKAAKRRLQDRHFTHRWFVGDGVDVGCGGDPLDPDLWPMVTSITQYDQIIDPSHDAQTLVGLADNTFDFLHSSHCLEHVVDIWTTLSNWLRVLKPGGFMIVTVPDWLRYEGMVWPSRHNSDHKHAFTTSAALYAQWHKQYGEIHKSSHFTKPTKYTLSHLPTVIDTYRNGIDIERIQLLSDKWVPSKIGEDQTLGEAECAIEFVVRKELPPGVYEQTMVETTRKEPDNAV